MKTVGPLEIGELKTVWFDFTTEAESTVTLNTPVVRCAVLDGTDALPDNVKVGSPLVNGLYVTQQVQPGVSGCTYKLCATCIDSGGNKHSVACRLKVVPA